MAVSMLPVLLTSILLVTETVAFAELRIRLLRLRNPYGQGANGHCCDGRSIFCFSQCDHQLTVCLDHASGSDSMSSCAYGRQTTGEVTDRNVVYFSTDIGGTANPMYFPLRQWPGRVKLKVNIVDKDDVTPDDFVDFLSTVISLTPDSPRPRFHDTLTLRNRVTLELEVSFSCLPSFYGTRCTQRMQAPPASGA